MTEKKTDTEDKNRNQKSSGKLVKLFLIFIVIFVAGIYLSMKDRPHFIENIYPNETINTNDSIKDNELIKDALEESYSVGAEPPVLSLSNEEDSQTESEDSEVYDTSNVVKDETTEVEVVNPYVSIVESESNAFNSSALKSRVNDYRFFLNNANSLIAKYRAGEGSEEEIRIFRKHIYHPMHINEFIKMLDSYNQLLADRPVFAEKKPVSMQEKLLTKFVKIKKIDSSDAEIAELRSKIDARLEIFTNYLYSQNLQDSFVK
jgi:hypothetical protein